MKNLTYKLWFLAVTLTLLTSCAKDGLEDELDTAELHTEVLPVAYSSFELEVLDLINIHRSELGLSELELLDDSSRQAEIHNQHMIDHDEVCHDDFPSRYSALVKSANAKAVSENVAYGYRTSDGVVSAWIKSDGHRKNMEGNHTHFGISINQDPSGKFYFTNIFVRK